MRLFIAIPGAGYMATRAHYAISAAIAAGLWYWYKKFGDAVDIKYRVTERMPVADARNDLAKAALSFEADYVWWIDDDMEPPPYALQRLHLQDAPIVSAFCAQRCLPPRVMAFRLDGKTGQFKSMTGDNFQGNWTVDAVGMACVLMKGEVLRKVYEQTNGKPFQYCEDPETGVRKYGTEEMYFFELASKMGYRTLMDADLDVGHLGLQRYDKSLVGTWGKKQDLEPAGRT